MAAPLITFWTTSANGGSLGQQLGGIDNNTANGYDDFGTVAIGSTFPIIRRIYNNKNNISPASSTATDLKFTLHQSEDIDGLPIDDPSQPPISGNDIGISPPSSEPLGPSASASTQWSVGGTGWSGAAVVDDLWTEVKIIDMNGTLVSNPNGYDYSKIGFISSSANPSYPGNRVIYHNPGDWSLSTEILNANYVSVKLNTKIPQAYTGSGILYARFHMEYAFV